MSESELIKIVDELRALPKEKEWFEFKNNKQLPNKEIGKYISAISNSACLCDQPSGYLIWGIENNTHKVVGTSFNIKSRKEGNIELEFWLNQNINPKINFSLHEFEYSQGKKISLITIPAARNQPTKFKGIAYIRIDSNKTELKNYPDKERKIWNIGIDWTEQICDDATTDDIDEIALNSAIKSYKQRNENKPFYHEIDNWDKKTFLDKAKLTLNGKITKAALLLIGKPETKRFLFSNLIISWIYIDDKGVKRYSELFDPPFFLAVDKVLNKIRNEKIKILPKDTVIPIEKTKYDNWIIREALNNCIAHQDYTKVSRIIVTEKPDELEFLSAGSFFQGTIEDYILSNYTPPKYRNPFLVNAMVSLGMIDTIGSGIKKMFLLQMERYMPLPDYLLTENVELTIYGNIIDQEYTQKLIELKDLDIGQVFLLDKIQKNYPIDDNDYIYVIISYLRAIKRATREDIDNLLFDKLDNNLNTKQKKDKIRNLLYKLSKKKNRIKNIGTKQKPIWILNC